MLLGLQTNSAWGPADFELIRPNMVEPPLFQSAKLYQTAGCRHTEAEVETLRDLGIQHFVMRLGDSIYEPDHQHLTKWRPTPEQYAEDCLRLIVRFRRVGVRDFVLDNEPNITWTKQGYTPREYAGWLLSVITYMRDRNWRDGWDLPPDVRLGLPPIAFTDEYPHMPYLVELRPAVPFFDFLAVHSYWQSSRKGLESILKGPLRWQRFGGSYELYREMWPGMPIQITEWGNSIHEQGVWTPQQVAGFRREQYPIWVAFARKYAEACHFFISSGATPDWDGYKIGVDIAVAMAATV